MLVVEMGAFYFQMKFMTPHFLELGTMIEGLRKMCKCEDSGNGVVSVCHHYSKEAENKMAKERTGNAQGECRIIALHLGVVELPLGYGFTLDEFTIVLNTLFSGGQRCHHCWA